MIGTEKFTFNQQDLPFDVTEFWKFHYSNIYNQHDKIAEFIVSRALGITEPHNDLYWTLWDISYRDKRIEVKETSYFHSFNEDGVVSKQRVFSIAKAHGDYDAEISGNKDFCRQNDVYVFCLNTGDTKASSNPLNLNNWEFYIVPTAFLNQHCGEQKTISLGRIRNFGFLPKRYDEIKAEVDLILNAIED